MSEARDLSLGPVTERRFAEAFGDGATITAKSAAAVLGLDVKTLGALTKAGAIRSVLRGKLPAYTERDLRAYLTEGPDACRSTSRPRAETVKQSRVVSFTQRRRPPR